MNSYIDKTSLKGKVAVVTGGLGLIGKEIAKAFSDAQATTVVIDIDPKKAELFINENNNMGNMYYENIDTTDLDNINNNLEGIQKKYGSIDVFVNNAYPRTADWGKTIEEMSLQSWRDNVDMHMNSYAWISRKVCLMMKEHGGSLINFGSIYGVLGNDFTIYEGTSINPAFPYSAIKGGIVNLTRWLASYFGKYNVRVNSICPGGVYDGQDKIFVDNYSHKTPLKRMADAQEVAGAVLFLACGLSSYITGETLMVDGGWSAI